MSVPQTLLHTFVRWLDLVALTTLVGGLVFRYLIIRATFLQPQGLDSFERRLRRVLAVSISLLALTSLGDLILRTLMMSGGGIVALGPALPVVLRRTHYGAVWIARIGGVGLLGAAWLLGRRDAGEISWSVCAFTSGAIIVALTTSLSGHAADWGDVTLPVLIDWLHLLAISTWIGGLFTFGFVLPSAVAFPGKEESLQGLASIATRFSRMAACCAAVFLTTGLYNARLHVASLSPLVTTSYGWALLAKLSLVGFVLMAAALNRYYFLPLLGSPGGTRDRLLFRTIGRLASARREGRGRGGNETIQHRFFHVVRLEWIMVVLALACSALLTQLPPARHIRRHEHREQHAIHRAEPGTATANASNISAVKGR